MKEPRGNAAVEAREAKPFWPSLEKTPCVKKSSTNDFVANPPGIDAKSNGGEYRTSTSKG